MRWRSITTAAVIGLVVLGCWYAWVRNEERYSVGELSCASDRFSATAIDFAGDQAWSTPEEALRGTLNIHSRAGMALPAAGEWDAAARTDTSARFERRSDGHLVGLVVFERTDDRDGWRFAPVNYCVDP